MPAKKIAATFLLLSCLVLIGTAVIALSRQQNSLAGNNHKITANKQTTGHATATEPLPTLPPGNFQTVWWTDYEGSNVKAVNHDGQSIWQQSFSFPSVPDSGQASNVEFMSVAPTGDLMVTTANGMLVQELDRATHKVVWQYGVLNQQYCDKCLHQPKKAYLLNNDEVLVTDANNRRVIIINKDTKQIVWQYGHTTVMSDKDGYLKGPRFAMPLDPDAKQILMSDTLQKKIMVVNRASGTIIWQASLPDTQWLQNVYPAQDGTFIAEDDLQAEIYDVGQDGQIIWTLHTLANGENLKYPTDAIPLSNGDVLIAEAGRDRVIEVNPQTKAIVWQYGGGTPKGASVGFITSLAVEY
jgi:outer membrane protein assembly factor BamB